MSRTYMVSGNARRGNKDKAMTGHFKKRFFQRFGIELTQNMMEYMLAQIKKHKSQYVGNQSCSRAIHIVSLPTGEEILPVVVIYNLNKRLIHTCFPISWLENGEYKQYLDEQAYINGF